MSRLDEALARLQAALDRLEASAEERLAWEREQAGSSAEISLLRAERERLFARIGALEQETRALAGLTQEVESRLDGAISELREALTRS